MVKDKPLWSAFAVAQLVSLIFLTEWFDYLGYYGHLGKYLLISGILWCICGLMYGLCYIGEKIWQ